MQCIRARQSLVGISHPDSRYFAIAQIQEDQLESYADRKGWDRIEAEKWLGPNING